MRNTKSNHYEHLLTSLMNMLKQPVWDLCQWAVPTGSIIPPLYLNDNYMGFFHITIKLVWIIPKDFKKLSVFNKENLINWHIILNYFLLPSNNDKIVTSFRQITIYRNTESTMFFS